MQGQEQGPWEDKEDDMRSEGIDPTDDMVTEALEDDRRDEADE